MTSTQTVSFASDPFNCYIVWSIASVTSLYGGDVDTNKWTLTPNADMSFGLEGATLTDGADYQVNV